MWHSILITIAAACCLTAQTNAVLDSKDVRVEVSLAGGRLQERWLAKNASGLVELLTTNGKTAGAVTVQRAGGVAVQSTAVRIEKRGESIFEEIAAGGLAVRRVITLENGPWVRVTTSLAATKEPLHAVRDDYRFALRPDWSFSPAIGGFNPDGTYKAPLILVQSGRVAAGIVPEVATLTREVLKRCSHALDLDVPAGPLLSVGFIPARRAFHSVYEEDIDRQWSADTAAENAYFVYVSAAAAPGQAFRDAVRLHWEKFARPLLASAAGTQSGTDERYKTLGLWNDWRRMAWSEETKAMWLEVPLPDGTKGGAVRMLRLGQPKPSLYLGAWFNSMRTAFGMALYARRSGDQELLRLAQQTVRAALKAPGRDGAFKCIAIDQGAGQPPVWAAGDGSGRSTRDGYLGFDMSWTAYWLLKWLEAKLPGSEEILERSRRLAAFFIARQTPDGMLPSRFDEDGATQPTLSRMTMAETAPIAQFLLEHYQHDPRPEYLAAARKALAFLDHAVVAPRKWYDFETFWSCSPRVEVFDQRTRQWPANNLALIHAASAYLKAFRATKDRAYLDKGQQVLDYLLLYQQSWTNPVLENLTSSNMLLGGLTTQNSDAEWSDARQSLAGNVLLDYYRATGNAEYLERGVQALRAQFPISPSENWAHEGYGRKAGVSGFHWGTGSGMAGIEIEEEFLRDAVVDVPSRRATGVNGLNVTRCRVEKDTIDIALESPYEWKSRPVVTFHGVEEKRLYRVRFDTSPSTQHTGAELQRGIEAPAPRYTGVVR